MKHYLISFIFFYFINLISCLSELDQNQIFLTIGSKTITATLDSNKAVNNLKTVFPLRVKMYDYASLAKGYNFSSSFRKIRKEDENMENLQIGDIILYDHKHLMIFYQNFKNVDKYIKVGHIDSVEGLKEKLGENDIEILWSLCDPQKDDCKVPLNNYYSSLIHYLTWKVFSFVCFLLL